MEEIDTREQLLTHIKKLTERLELLAQKVDELENELQYVRALALYPRVYPTPYIPWLLPTAPTPVWYSTATTSVTVGDTQEAP